jgi:hypothetical protein
MKLILCKECGDIVKCLRYKRYCDCGASWGQYTDDLNAIYGGKALPLGFANSSLVSAVSNQPASGMGQVFEAFVIPKQCPTYKEDKNHA